MNLKKKICAITLAGTVAVSGMGLGYAAWHTNITANGGVSASGHWDVAITDARISQLSGATIGSQSTEITGCAFQLSGQTTQEAVAAAVAAKAQGPVGSPSDSETLGEGFFVVDTSIYDIENIAALSLSEVAADGSSALDLSSRPRYYRTDSSGSSDDAAVVQALFTDTYEMLAASNPAETLHDHYALVYLSSDSAQNAVYAVTQQQTNTTVTDTETTFTATSADFADVSFTSPGGWAEYTITVTNNGTVDAVLDSNSVQLDTENDQLELKTPDLSSDVLAPGQSCTFTFTVQAKADITDDLNDTGTLSVSLSYTQPAVEPIPAPTHSVHN